MKIKLEKRDAVIVSDVDRLEMAYEMLAEILLSRGATSCSVSTGDALIVVSRDEMGTIEITDATIIRKAFLTPRV